MTADLEDRIRTSLRQRAEAVHVVPGDPHELRSVRHPDRRRRVEIAAIAAALVLFVGAGLVVALRGREATAPAPAVGEGTGPVPTEPVQPAPGPLADLVAPGALVTLPSPWTLHVFFFSGVSPMNSLVVAETIEPGTDMGPPMVEYQFIDVGRSIQVNFYGEGERQPAVTTAEPPLVDVRGTTGFFLDYGGGRFRVQWDEGGRTWDVDADGFDSLDELVSTLALLEWQDDSTWSASMPPGLADAIRDNPLGSVTWNDADGTVRATSDASGGAGR